MATVLTSLNASHRAVLEVLAACAQPGISNSAEMPSRVSHAAELMRAAAAQLALVNARTLQSMEIPITQYRTDLLKLQQELRHLQVRLTEELRQVEARRTQMTAAQGWTKAMGDLRNGVRER